MYLFLTDVKNLSYSQILQIVEIFIYILCFIPKQILTFKNFNFMKKHQLEFHCITYSAAS